MRATTKEQGFYSQIFKLVLPIVIQNLLSAAVNSADVVMLNYVGQSAISAVSLASNYANVLFMVYYGLGTGATLLCAQYFGKGNMRAIQTVEGIALRFSVIISVVVAGIAFTMPQMMMRLFTDNAELIRIGASYLRVMGVTYLCWGITEIYLAVLRSLGRVTISMADIAKDAVIKAAGLLERFDDSAASDVAAMETQLDHFEDELGTYLVKLSRREVSEADSQEITKMLHTISDFERIGDHADNLIQVAREIRDKNISFSGEAQEEIDRLTQAVLEIVSVTAGAFACADVSRATSVEPLEQVIDMLIAGIKSRHVSRLRSGDCTIMHGFVLNDLLMNYERISDHCSNIAVAVIMAQDEAFDTHSYLRKIKSEQTGHFAKLYEQYLDKYAL